MSAASGPAAGMCSTSHFNCSKRSWGLGLSTHNGMYSRVQKYVASQAYYANGVGHHWLHDSSRRWWTSSLKQRVLHRHIDFSDAAYYEFCHRGLHKRSLTSCSIHCNTDAVLGGLQCAGGGRAGYGRGIGGQQIRPPGWRVQPPLGVPARCATCILRGHAPPPGATHLESARCGLTGM